MATEIILSPAQQAAFDALNHGLGVGNILTLMGGDGTGKTSILRRLHAQQGGAFLGIKDFVDALGAGHPLALEEALYGLLLGAVRENDLVFIDDLHLVTNVVTSCYGGSYPRSNLIDAPAAVIAAYVVESGKRLVIASGGAVPGPLSVRAFGWGIPDFEVADYEHLCRASLPAPIADRLDYAKIYRFAPNLDAHQLCSSCKWMGQKTDTDTESLIDYLRSQHLTSNVQLSEVQQVSLEDLIGVDDVIEALETNIVLPFENDELSAELDLKPKRGVLLAGPPGTGKTTVGRALAHRLKSKFFLVDGTFISGTDRFYGAIHHVFQEAKENAPSVIFIDDSDVIFESGEESGLYRYLLTMLDGLESETAAQVCVMLTAMDVGNLPPALLRSGRVELWLETRLPDLSARTLILEKHLRKLPESIGAVDAPRLAEATESFTGADLKRLVEDGKLLLGSARVRQEAAQPATEYFVKAVEAVKTNRARYASAEQRARKERPQRPVWFNPMAEDGDG